MEQRFIRNIPAITEQEQLSLRDKRALIVGCGGLGGYIAEFMARAGIGGLSLVDGDKFDETNLNRQTLALPALVGESKALAAAERVKSIDPNIDVCTYCEFFAAENAEVILEGADIVLDALDNIPARLLLEDKCAEKGISLVHGAVEGWSAQVCVAEPGANMLHRLYGSVKAAGGKSVISPLPAFCASIQCGEALKILCGRASELTGKLLVADIQTMDFVKLDF